MSNAALKAAVTGTDVTKSNGKPTTLIELLSSDKTKHQLAAALPKHMTADRMARVIMTELRKVPKLAACDPHSFMGAVMMASQVGLEPGGALGHCYLIPFENRRANRVEVQFIMGYRGMLDLARRSGQIVSIEARAGWRRRPERLRHSAGRCDFTVCEKARFGKGCLACRALGETPAKI